MTTTDDVEENLPNPLTPTTSAEDSLTFYDCDQLLNSFPGCSNAVVYKATVCCYLQLRLVKTVLMRVYINSVK